MTPSSFTPHKAPDRSLHWDASTDENPAAASDTQLVLVAASSAVNRIVVSHIVERCGLRAVTATPGEAPALLKKVVPGLAILDGGPDNRDCDGVLSAITAYRQQSGGSLPQVILLSNRIGTPQSLALDVMIDIVVAKPITPECLQPVVSRMIGSHP